MADYKPSDLFLSINDLFAVFLPGVCLTFIMSRTLKGQMMLDGRLYDLFEVDTDLKKIIVFFLASFLIGQLLNAMGAIFLDKLIEYKFFKKIDKNEKTSLEFISRNLMQQGIIQTNNNKVCELADGYADRQDLVSWVCSYIRLSKSDGITEFERLSAQAKFFRSMTFVLSVSGLCIFIFLLNGFGIVFCILCFVMAVGAFYRFRQLRWNAGELAFEYYIMLKTELPIGTKINNKVQDTDK